MFLSFVVVIHVFDYVCVALVLAHVYQQMSVFHNFFFFFFLNFSSDYVKNVFF